MKEAVMNRLLRWILIVVGWLSVVTGVVGIFLPLVPTVPCLLLACFCFSRSSARFHGWLVQHRHLGPLVAYGTHGIPIKAKILAIAMIWVSVTASLVLLGPPRWVPSCCWQQPRE
jgi:uncharacterized protein